jgi:hypothetical protein
VPATVGRAINIKLSYADRGTTDDGAGEYLLEAAAFDRG